MLDKTAGISQRYVRLQGAAWKALAKGAVNPFPALGAGSVWARCPQCLCPTLGVSLHQHWDLRSPGSPGLLCHHLHTAGLGERAAACRELGPPELPGGKHDLGAFRAPGVRCCTSST